MDTGSIDPLNALADLAEREGLWFHVDGAFGALARLAPDLAPLLAGLERANSLAFDFHKWAQVPYDAGCVLVREPGRQAAAFAQSLAYLSREDRGLAAGAPWFCDLGPDLSRGSVLSRSGLHWPDSERKSWGRLLPTVVRWHVGWPGRCRPARTCNCLPPLR